MVTWLGTGRAGIQTLLAVSLGLRILTSLKGAGGSPVSPELSDVRVALMGEDRQEAAETGRALKVALGELDSPKLGSRRRVLRS